jgi:CubicO group peptidase (beta-lactamase class C family)
VDGDSQYRIASISKTFTTLALLYQHEAGNLSLDDPVDLYVPELAAEDSGAVPWKDITLRIMASQLSGIPRETDQSDVINSPTDPTKIGLPPASRKGSGLPDCYQYSHYRTPCTRDQLLDYLKIRQPIFAPNQKSTYSNANFELLGMVISNVTGMSYEDYIAQAIFGPLNMTFSSTSTPPDTHAVLPLGQGFWDVQQGLHIPTGGIYSSANDMSKYCRYILTHYNAIATGVNWLMPASWSDSSSSFYGMPFEIYRADNILVESRRPVTFVTKSGGLPMYFTIMILIPEYGLAVNILTAGNQDLKEELIKAVTVDLVRTADTAIWGAIDKRYSGDYSPYNSPLNSSMSISSTPSTGLIVNSFVSNATDVFEALLPHAPGGSENRPWRAQLVPTYLYKNESTQQGEVWRMTLSHERDEKSGEGPWDDFCITDLDYASYGGLPLNEVVFWREEGLVELPAWKIKMRKDTEREQGAEKMVVQAP